ncbi:hypothetical protein [Micromonospora sp. NPDC049102]
MPFQSPESTVKIRVIVVPQAAHSIGYGSVSDQFANPPTFHPGASDRSL